MKGWSTIFILGLGSIGASGAILPQTNPGKNSASGLTATVAAMAEKGNKPAKDYASMAEETIRFGQRPDAVEKLNESSKGTKDAQAPWRNMVGDALTGVDEGERIDKNAADWARLRDELKKLQPPPPPQSQQKKDSKKDSSEKDKKDKEKKDKKSGDGKGDPQEQQGGKGEKTEKKSEGGESKDSQGPPSPGEGGQGGEKEESKGDSQGKGSETEGKGGDQKKQEAKEKGKDPNQIKDYSSSKEQEGTMRDRAKEDDLAPIQDKSAGFGNMGEEKKEEGKKEAKKGPGKGQDDSKKSEKEAASGMRTVGGGTGKKKQEDSGDAYTVEATARLDQVRQSDSPALLQQRLQPKDQRPSPSSTAKPW